MFVTPIIKQDYNLYATRQPSGGTPRSKSHPGAGQKKAASIARVTGIASPATNRMSHIGTGRPGQPVPFRPVPGAPRMKVSRSVPLGPGTIEGLMGTVIPEEGPGDGGGSGMPAGLKSKAAAGVDVADAGDRRAVDASCGQKKPTGNGKGPVKETTGKIPEDQHGTTNMDNIIPVVSSTGGTRLTTPTVSVSVPISVPEPVTGSAPAGLLAAGTHPPRASYTPRSAASTSAFYIKQCRERAAKAAGAAGKRGRGIFTPNSESASSAQARKLIDDDTLPDDTIVTSRGGAGRSKSTLKQQKAAVGGAGGDSSKTNLTSRWNNRKKHSGATGITSSSNGNHTNNVGATPQGSTTAANDSTSADTATTTRKGTSFSQKLQEKSDKFVANRKVKREAQQQHQQQQQQQRNCMQSSEKQAGKQGHSDHTGLVVNENGNQYADDDEDHVGKHNSKARRLLSALTLNTNSHNQMDATPGTTNTTIEREPKSAPLAARTTSTDHPTSGESSSSSSAPIVSSAASQHNHSANSNNGTNRFCSLLFRRRQRAGSLRTPPRDILSDNATANWSNRHNPAPLEKHHHHHQQEQQQGYRRSSDLKHSKSLGHDDDNDDDNGAHNASTNDDSNELIGTVSNGNRRDTRSHSDETGTERQLLNPTSGVTSQGGTREGLPNKELGSHNIVSHNQTCVSHNNNNNHSTAGSSNGSNPVLRLFARMKRSNSSEGEEPLQEENGV